MVTAVVRNTRRSNGKAIAPIIAADTNNSKRNTERNVRITQQTWRVRVATVPVETQTCVPSIVEMRVTVNNMQHWSASQQCFYGIYVDSNNINFLTSYCKVSEILRFQPNLDSLDRLFS